MKAFLRRIFVSGLFVIMAFSMVGCDEIKVENGEVPEEYLAAAEKYLGDYEGEFNGFKGTFSIRLEGRKLIASYANDFGEDLLHPDCQSEIGALIRLGGKKKNKKPVLKRAIFAFYSNLCNKDFQGKELIVYVKEKNNALQLTLSIEKWGRWRERCTYYPDHPRRGPYNSNLESNSLDPEGYRCNQYYESENETGRFTKI